MPSTTLSRGAALSLTCGALLATAAAPSAHAVSAAVTPDGQFLNIGERSPGERNELFMRFWRTVIGTQVVEIIDYQGASAGPGCVQVTELQVNCEDPAQQIRVRLGGGDDTAQLHDGNIAFGPGALDIDLGDGNDRHHAEEQNSQATVRGGAGNDELIGSQNADVLDGGPGDDRINGFGGDDTIRGGDGNDTVSGDSYSNLGIGADVIDGGPGVDLLIDYRFSGDPQRAPGIDVSLDGVANDGRAGEGDNLLAIEQIQSGSAGSFTGSEGADEFRAPQVGPSGTLRGLGGDDVLMAGDASGDVLEGGAGSDHLEGGFGDDRLVGGPGRDTLVGDRQSRCNEYACDLIVSGNDTIEAVDGEVDSISCGPGSDVVRADTIDIVDATCETVDRVAVAPGPGPTPGPGPAPAPSPGAGGGAPTPGGQQPAGPTLKLPKTKLRTALSRGLKVQVSDAKGKLRLTARHGSKVVARGSATARKGKATVTLRFTAAAKRKLRRASKLTLTVRGAGAPRKVTLRR